MQTQVLVAAAVAVLSGHPWHLCPSPTGIFLDTSPLALGESARDATRDQLSDRLAAPTVILRDRTSSSISPTNEATSWDRPSYWTPYSYGPLSVEVRCPIDLGLGPVEFVTLFLDNQPVENKRFLSGSDLPVDPLASPGLSDIFRFELPCPTPGKHILQARYKQAGVWSELSLPLRFEVLFPKRPEIISVFGEDDVGARIRLPTIVKIRGDTIHIKVADARAEDLVVGYLDGKKFDEANLSPDCCITLSIANRVPPGLYTLTVKVVPFGEGCRLASEHSNEVQIHYYDENVYLLKPGLLHATLKGTKQSKTGSSKQAPAASPPENLPTPAHDPVRTNGFERRSSVLKDASLRRHRMNIQQAATKPTGSPFVLAGFQQAEKPEEKPEQDSKTSTGVEAAQGHARTAVEAVQRAIKAKDQASAAVTKARNATDEARGFVPTAKSNASDADEAARRAEALTASAARELARAEQAVGEAAIEKKLRGAFEHWTTASNAGNAAKTAHQKTQAASIESRGQAGRAQTASTQCVDLAIAAEYWLNQAIEQEDVAAEALRAAMENQSTTEELLQKIKDLPANRDAATVDAAGRAAEQAQRRATAAAQKAADAAQAAEQIVPKVNQCRDRAKQELDASATHRLNAINQENLGKASSQSVTDHANRAFAAASETAKLIAADAVNVALAAQQEFQRADGAVRGARRALDQTSEAHRNAELHAARARQFAKNAARAAERAATAAQDANKASIWLGVDTDDDAVQRRNVAGESAKQATAAADEAKAQANLAQECVDAAASNEALAVSNFNKAKQASDHAGDTAKKSEAVATLGRAREAERFRRLTTDARMEAAAFATAAENAAANAESHAAKALQHRDYAADQVPKAEHASVRATANASLAQARANQISEAVTPQLKSLPLADARATAVLAKQRADEFLERARIQAEIARSQANAAAAGVVNVDPPAVAADKALRRSFFFASAAHFPLRGFGPRGQVLDGEGAVIYEDMEFVFNENGDYEVVFRIGAPAVPTVFELQILIQVEEGPWFTLTLPPKYIEESLEDPRTVHKRRISGHSEVLKRAFGQISNVRREGTARFGFGLDALSRATAY